MTGKSLKATPSLGIRPGKVRLGFFKFFMGDLLADQLLNEVLDTVGGGYVKLDGTSAGIDPAASGH